MTEETGAPEVTDLLIACVDFLRRMGAKSIQIRYSDDEEPTVWFLVTEHQTKQGPYFETAAGMSPDIAAVRLCEKLADGGRCMHCKRPTGFTEEVDTQLLDDLICWYQYDPELKTVRRGCE